MPRSDIHGSPRSSTMELISRMIRMHSVVAKGLDYGCNMESYGPVQIATNDARSYPWLIWLCDLGISQLHKACQKVGKDFRDLQGDSYKYTASYTDLVLS